MSKPDVIKIDDVEYVRSDKQKAFDGDIKIIVADRGFVYVGVMNESTDFITLCNAKNIRVWGTTKGLGELVNGPVSSTKLDYCGEVAVDYLTVIATIDCQESKWVKKL